MQFKFTKAFLLYFAVMTASTVIYAQNDSTQSTVVASPKKIRNRDTTGKWTFYGTSAISTNQSQFSNWQQGGINSISLTTGLNLNLGFANQSISWQNVLDINYGLSLQGNTSTWYKNDDRVSFSTKLGFRATKNWNYTIITSCSTQFQPGYNSIDEQMLDFKASDFFAPATFISSIGIDYNPSPKLSVFIGPISSKNIIVNNQLLANMGVGGITPAEFDYATGKYLNDAKKHMAEMGGYVKVQFYEPRVLKNISIQSTLELFNNYLRNASRVDVNLQNDINIKLNEYIATNIILNLKYDDDILFDGPDGRRGPRIQFMQVLGVGLAINLGKMY